MHIPTSKAQSLVNLDLKPKSLNSEGTTTNGHAVVNLSEVIATENNKTPSKPSAKKEGGSIENFTLSSKTKQVIAIALVIVGLTLVGLGFLAEIAACSLSGAGLGSVGAFMYYLTSGQALPLAQKSQNPEKPTSPVNPANPVVPTSNNSSLPILPGVPVDAPPPLPPRKHKKPKPTVVITPGILGVPFLPPLYTGSVPRLPGVPGVPSIPPISGTLPTPTIPGTPGDPFIPPTNGIPPVGIKPGTPGNPTSPNPGTPGNPTLPNPGTPGIPPTLPKPGIPNVPLPPTSGLPNVPPTSGLPPIGINPTIPGVPPTLPTPSLPTPGTPYVPPISIGVPPIGSNPGIPGFPPTLPRPGVPNIPPTCGIPPVVIKPIIPGIPPTLSNPGTPFIPPVIIGLPPAIPGTQRRPPKLKRMPKSRKLLSPQIPFIPVVLPMGVPPISTTTNDHKVINLAPVIVFEIDRTPHLDPKMRKENAIHFAKLTDSLKAKQQKEKQNIKNSWFTPQIQRLVAIALAVIGLALAGLGFFAGFAAFSFPGIVLGVAGAVLFFINQSSPRAQKPLKPGKIKISSELKSGLDKIFKKRTEDLTKNPPMKATFERLKKEDKTIDPKIGFQPGHPNRFYEISYKEKKWFCPKNGFKTKSSVPSPAKTGVVKE